MKVCTKCKKEKELSEFCKNKSKLDGLSTECRSCRKTYMQTYYNKNKKVILDQNKTRGRERHYEAKKLCIEHYSNGTNSCECCGETIPEFLTINHINGGGNKDRAQAKGARTFYEYLVKNNYPDGLNVLCYNCNCSMGFFGYCPHQKETDK